MATMTSVDNSVDNKELAAIVGVDVIAPVAINAIVVVVLGTTGIELSDDARLQFPHGLQLVTPNFPEKPAAQKLQVVCAVAFPVLEPGGHAAQELTMFDKLLKELTAQATHEPGVGAVNPPGQTQAPNDVLPVATVTV